MQLEKVMYARLFSKLQVGGIDLKNRLIIAPTYLGYAGAGGTASPLLLDHYRLMAASGVAMVVVENGKDFIGEYMEVNITKVLQTAAGRMIFGRVDEETARKRK